MTEEEYIFINIIIQNSNKIKNYYSRLFYIDSMIKQCEWTFSSEFKTQINRILKEVKAFNTNKQQYDWIIQELVKLQDYHDNLKEK